MSVIHGKLGKVADGVKEFAGEFSGAILCVRWRGRILIEELDKLGWTAAGEDSGSVEADDNPRPSPKRIKLVSKAKTAPFVFVVMNAWLPSMLLVFACCLLGCRAPAPMSKSVETDWPPSARYGAYSAIAIPSITSPEGFNRLLEQRWSLADIRTFCIPERRHNPAYQNLVAMGEVWKGRLYEGVDAGFDRIGWYANIEDGHIGKYSLEVQRGRNFWLLEIGSPESLRLPPHVAPDPKAPHFVGHR